jgi:hypothetical protein
MTLAALRGCCSCIGDCSRWRGVARHVSGSQANGVLQAVAAALPAHVGCGVQAHTRQLCVSATRSRMLRRCQVQEQCSPSHFITYDVQCCVGSVCGCSMHVYGWWKGSSAGVDSAYQGSLGTIDPRDCSDCVDCAGVLDVLVDMDLCLCSQLRCWQATGVSIESCTRRKDICSCISVSKGCPLNAGARTITVADEGGQGQC